MAHASLAIARDLQLIPVLNKMDLPSARPDEIAEELKTLIGIKKEEIIHASARDRIGIQEILEKVVTDIPSPQGLAQISTSEHCPPFVPADSAVVTDIPSPQGLAQQNNRQSTAPALCPPVTPRVRALVFDSWFDSYQGVVALCRVMEGEIKVGDEVLFMQGGKKSTVLKVGVFTPFPLSSSQTQHGGGGFCDNGH